MLPLLFLLLIAPQIASAGFSCKNQKNEDVDFFMVYKMPIDKDNSLPGVNEGLAFYYLDVNEKTAFTPSQEPLNATNQAIAYTLQQYYNEQTNKDVFHVMFNDEPPVSKSYSNEIDASVQFGHTKGTIFFDGTSGVYLIHSVPKFPLPTKYEYPDSGTIYGQTMLCLTMSYSQLKYIGTQLLFNHPDIYSSYIPASMSADNPDLQKVLNGQFQKGTPQTSLITLATRGGRKFKSYAKSGEFGKDLYEGFVAPTLNTGLVVESWRRGDEIPLVCGDKYVVLDALTIGVGKTTEFKYTKDHSKMARSSAKASPWVCIGDVNRMTSQYVRGGGTTCFSDASIWNAFNVIKTQNECK